MASMTLSAIPRHPLTPVLGWRGNAIQFYSNPIRYMQMLYARYGRVVDWAHRKHRSDQTVLFLFGPEYNKLVLANPDLFHTLLFDRPPPPNTSFQRLASGLRAMNGEQHRQQRRLIMPSFTREHVKSYRDDIVALTEQALAGWRVGDQRDIAAEMQKLTLAIVSRTLFGVDLSDEHGDIGPLTKAWLALATSGPVIVFPKAIPGTPYHRLLSLSERLERKVVALLEQKQANPAVHRDILATMLQTRDEDGARMEIADLVGHANVLVIAGHETSSNTLTWALFLLAQHPEVLANLLDELSSVLQGQPPTLEQLERLVLLDQVLKETLRLMPPSTYNARLSTGPFQVDQHELPANTIVYISDHMTHRLPEFYTNPLRFQPERWASLDPAPYTYFPFSAGPRKCVGQHFAVMEMKLILAMVLQRYRLSVPAGAQIDYKVGLTLAPRQGLPMLVAQQDRQFKANKIGGTILELVEVPGNSCLRIFHSLWPTDGDER